MMMYYQSLESPAGWCLSED